MSPRIDGEHHEERPLLHDLLYHLEDDGTPILDEKR